MCRFQIHSISIFPYAWRSTAQPIVQALEKNVDAEEVQLGGNTLGLDAMKAISLSLPHMANLKVWSSMIDLGVHVTSTLFVSIAFRYPSVAVFSLRLLLV